MNNLCYWLPSLAVAPATVLAYLGAYLLVGRHREALAFALAGYLAMRVAAGYILTCTHWDQALLVSLAGSLAVLALMVLSRLEDVRLGLPCYRHLPALVALGVTVFAYKRALALGLDVYAVSFAYQVLYAWSSAYVVSGLGARGALGVAAGVLYVSDMRELVYVLGLPPGHWLFYTKAIAWLPALLLYPPGRRALGVIAASTVASNLVLQLWGETSLSVLAHRLAALPAAMAVAHAVGASGRKRG